MDRRNFIRSGCGYCAGIAGLNILGALLEGCKPADMIYQAQITGGKILIPVEKLSGKKFLVIRVPRVEYDLLLVKEDEGSYHTLVMECTHRQQPLVVTSTGLFCDEHGSRFDFYGNVRHDPATEPLRRCKTELSGSNVVIYKT